jgi:hypothetical protein
MEMTNRETVSHALLISRGIINGVLASQTRDSKNIDDERRKHIKELKGYSQKIQDGIDALERL